MLLLWTIVAGLVALVVWSAVAAGGRADRRKAEDEALAATIFLTGPTHNSEYFEQARRLRGMGYRVLTAEYNAVESQGVVMRRVIGHLLTCEVVAVTHLWDYWSAPKMHVALANAMGLPIVYAGTLAPLPREKKALEVVRLDGSCECMPEAVRDRVGELRGQHAKASIAGNQTPAFETATHR